MQRRQGGPPARADVSSSSAFLQERADEGLPPLSLPDLLYIENPYSYKKCQWQITARPRILACLQERAAFERARFQASPGRARH